MICDALRAFNLGPVRTVTTPIEFDTNCNGDETEELVLYILYVKLSVRYFGIANSTRPDIAYATNFASSHREKPRKDHWELIERLFFRYLTGILARGSRYWKTSEAVSVKNLEVNI
uniref:Uncharacterized protein n=1 Tax=Peronospora matthiolae TaxID=2874970 RepID=A0AAV1UIG7_9STRA